MANHHGSQWLLCVDAIRHSPAFWAWWNSNMQFLEDTTRISYISMDHFWMTLKTHSKSTVEQERLSGSSTFQQEKNRCHSRTEASLFERNRARENPESLLQSILEWPSINHPVARLPPSNPRLLSRAVIDIAWLQLIINKHRHIQL